MERKEHRAPERQQISARDREPGADAQQIHPEHRGCRAEPDPEARLFARQHPDDRHKDDIQRRHEPGLADRRVQQAELLQCRRREQQHAADRARCQLALFILLRDRPVLRPALAVQHPDDRQQHQPRQKKPRRAHRKRADILHALALRDERRAPDHGAQEKKNTALCLLVHGFAPLS